MQYPALLSVEDNNSSVVTSGLSSYNHQPTAVPSGVHMSSTGVAATKIPATDWYQPAFASSGVPPPLGSRGETWGSAIQRLSAAIHRGPFDLSTGGNWHSGLSNESFPPGLKIIPRQTLDQNHRPPITNADEPFVKIQHASEPIYTTVTNEQKPLPHMPHVQIKQLDLEGKSMACLIKDGTPYALLEALSRVFFPYVNMDNFLYAVELMLAIPVIYLTDEEVQGFIKFYAYGLPTSKLECKKAIKLQDFSRCLPQLRYMYRERAEAAKAQGPVKK